MHHVEPKKGRPQCLQIENLSKSYPSPQGILPVLSDISLTLRSGDAASVMGPSGSGKSTLLYILGALEPPTQGTVQLEGLTHSNSVNLSFLAFGTKNRIYLSRPLSFTAM